VRGIEGDLPEIAAANVWDAVVPGETLVDERVIRVEQLDERAVLADDGVEEQLGLSAQRPPQVGVEARRFGLDGGQVAKIQPLASEVLNERARLAVRDHSLDLALQRRRIAQPVLGRQVEELLVRNAAPQEE